MTGGARIPAPDRLVRVARLDAAAASAGDARRRRAPGTTRLLVAATGAGKTLAGFLPTLAELIETPQRRAAHALRLAAQGAGGRRAAQSADAGRGDGARHPRRDAHRRHAERPQGAAAVKPPNILLTTPESLVAAAQLSRQLHDVRRPAGRSWSTKSTPSPPASAATCSRLCMARLQRIAPGAAPRRAVGDGRRSRRLPRLARARRRYRHGRAWSRASRAPRPTSRSCCPKAASPGRGIRGATPPSR